MLIVCNMLPQSMSVRLRVMEWYNWKHPVLFLSFVYLISSIFTNCTENKMILQKQKLQNPMNFENSSTAVVFGGVFVVCFLETFTYSKTYLALQAPLPHTWIDFKSCLFFSFFLKTFQNLNSITNETKHNVFQTFTHNSQKEKKV